MKLIDLRTVFLLPLAASAAGAQNAARLPFVNCPRPSAMSADVLGSLAGVRHLPNGNVLVNDQAGRRVLLLDSTARARRRRGRLHELGEQLRPARRRADRISRRLDAIRRPAALSMLVIDPAGTIARVMAAPRARGRRVSHRRTVRQSRLRRERPARLPPLPFQRHPARTRSAVRSPRPPESAAVVRFDLATRKLDTAAFFKLRR